MSSLFRPGRRTLNRRGQLWWRFELRRSALGFGLRGRVTGQRLLGYSLAGSVLFFVVTNFAAWVASPFYPQTSAGLMAAFVAGIPFFKWTLLGTLAYAALLFGGFALLRRRLPVLGLQTV